MSSSAYQVIIVGAGWYGIAAARRYLELDPSVSLLVVDDNSSIGGVWARSRIYPHLYTNQPTPLFEYPDLSMKEVFGLEDWVDISGDMICDYLELYAAKFGVTERCKFNTQVQKIGRDQSGQWQVFVSPTGGQPGRDTQELKCDKLIMATGFTSLPRLPKNIDTKTYTGKVFHVKEISQRYHELLDDPKVKNITLVGGSKSAWETAGLFALEGKKVNWLIREDGLGPQVMPRARPDGKTHQMKGKNARALYGMAPSPYSVDRWITQFLYGGRNWFGRWFTANFWKLPLKADLAKLTGNRAILKPMTDSLFWVSAGLSIVHPHDELIYDAIDDGHFLTIKRAHITSTVGITITIDSSITGKETIESDALIFATGWSPPYTGPNGPLFSPALALDLELPIPLASEPKDHKTHWAALEDDSKAKIYCKLPLLEHPPDNLNLHLKPARQTSYAHHFRTLVPPNAAARGDRNIIFLSSIHVASLGVHSYLAALWSYAYLEDMLPLASKAPIAGLLKDRDAMEKDIAWTDTYFRLKSLNLIQDVALSAFETREVLDRLLLDLGIRCDRKAMMVPEGVWFREWKMFFVEWFSNYGTEEYRGVLEEYLEIMGKK